MDPEAVIFLHEPHRIFITNQKKSSGDNACSRSIVQAIPQDNIYGCIR